MFKNIFNIFKKRDSSNPDVYAGVHPLFSGTLDIGTVSKDKALTIPVFYSVISILANDIANLPVKIQRETDKGGKEYNRKNKRVSFMMNKFAYENMGSGEAIKAIICNLLIHGNAFAYCVRDKRGVMIGFIPLANDLVRYKKNRETAKIEYTVGTGNEIYTSYEIIHFIKDTYNGYSGISPLQVLGDTLSTVNISTKFTKASFTNVARTKIAIEQPAPDKVSGKEAMQEFLARKRNFESAYREENMSPENAGMPLWLPPNTKATIVNLNADQKELIESKKLLVGDILAVYSMPPYKLGIMDKMNYSNITALQKAYASTTLRPIISVLERKFTEYLFIKSEFDYGWEATFDMQELIRGDSKTESEIVMKELTSGARTINEARRTVGLPEHAEGDQLYIPTFLVREDTALKNTEVSHSGKEATKNLTEAQIKKVEAEIKAIEKQKKEKKEKEKEKEKEQDFIKQTPTPREITVPQKRDDESDEWRDARNKAYNRNIGTQTNAITSLLTDFRNILQSYPDTTDYDIIVEAQEYLKKIDKNRMSSVTKAMKRVSDVVADEMAVDEIDIDEYLTLYLTGDKSVADRIVTKSAVSINRTAKGEIEEVRKLVADIASEENIEKHINYEKVRNTNAVVRESYKTQGITQIRVVLQGSENCPFCKEASEKVYDIDKPLYAKGDVIKDKNGNELVSKKNRFNPPLHSGCNCYLLKV